MRKIEDDYRDERGGYEGALVWKMTRKMYRETFLENAEVKEWYQKWCMAKRMAYTDSMQVLDEDFKCRMVSELAKAGVKEYCAPYSSDEREMFGS